MNAGSSDAGIDPDWDAIQKKRIVKGHQNETKQNISSN